MTYQALARRWRPQSFDQMVGQEHVLRALVNALGHNRLHHAYLLTGTRGVGKTTLARLLAKGLNCEHGVSATPCGECAACREISEGRFVDLIEVDAASRTKVEDTRDLLENVQYAPTRGRFKVYLIDEVHMLSGHSFNALLKTLEEPPPHVKFLLATTDPQRLPATVLSRCLQFHLRNLSPEQIAAHLARVMRAEQVPFDEAALMDLALAADGSVRDSLSLADQAISYGSGEIRSAQVAEMLGHVNRELMHALIQALLAADAPAVLAAVDSLARKGTDFERALQDLLIQLHRVALAQSVPASLEGMQTDRAQLERWAAMARPEDVQLYYQIGIVCRRDMPYAPDPRSGMEMALLRMLAFRPRQAPESVAPSRESVDKPAIRVAVSAQALASAEVGGAVKKSDTTLSVLAGAASAKPLVAPTAAIHAEQVTATLVDVGPDNWAALLAQLDLHGMARNVAENCVPERAEANALQLLLQDGREMLYNAQCDERISAAMTAYFGCSVEVTVRVGNSSHETPAARAARHACERQLQAERAIDTDPNVSLLLKEFGGRLHRDSIRARESLDREIASGGERR